MARRSPLDRYSVTQQYLMTRGQAITFPSKYFKIKLQPNEVYGVVIDMPMGNSVLTTMVSFINGATNLYFNMGGEYTGASQKYVNLVQATRTLVLYSNNILSQCEKVKSYDLPIGNKHFAYLITNKGVYKTEFLPATVAQESPEKRGFFNLYQKVLAEVRNCQLKDQASRG
ncbi:MAG: hypothetical protein K2G63_01480 [Oscillospiraceae bacterium]|nr:hypothetical protein [Oscillospiraceae bacterium]